MRSGMYTFQATERIAYGRPAAEALAAEVARLNAQRVFLIASGTMNRTTTNPRPTTRPEQVLEILEAAA